MNASKVTMDLCTDNLLDIMIKYYFGYWSFKLRKLISALQNKAVVDLNRKWHEERRKRIIAFKLGKNAKQKSTTK